MLLFNSGIRNRGNDRLMSKQPSCDVLPRRTSMDAAKRNLAIGLVGMLILLISVLVYAQVNASYNFDLGKYEQSADD